MATYPNGTMGLLNSSLGVTMAGNRHTGLGDIIEEALTSVGITEDRLSGWLGRPCGCRRRKLKLNRLSDWAARVIRGTSKQDALTELADMTEDTSLAEPKSGEG